MKANELRIGNYIGDKNDIAIVESIDKDGCIVQFINDEKQGFRISEPIKAIPLTEEWLLRFGFIKVGSEWKLFPCFEVQIIAFNEDNYNGVMFYTRTIHTDYTPIYCGNYINYVHQLQNLYFALTNEELTMK
jgi:hypothetical protein